MISAIFFILFIAAGYLLGSVCSAVIVSRIFDLPDPRTAGSKNPGATNVLRLSGKKYASIVLLADMLKGFIPVVLANLITDNYLIASCTCLAAVLGHMFPIFFDFKGGKGVATAIGGLLGLHFFLGVVSIGAWLLIANFSGYSSFASIITMTLAPFLSIIMTKNLDSFPPLAIVAIFILYQHRENISRLMDGKESKIKFRRHDITDITNQLIHADGTEAVSEPKKTAKKSVKKPAKKPTTVAATKSVAKKTSKKPVKKAATKAAAKPAAEKTKKPVKKVAKKTVAKKTKA